jgi:hypothetical protein
MHRAAACRRSSVVASAPSGLFICQGGVIAVEHPAYLAYPGYRAAERYKGSADYASALLARFFTQP